MSLFRVNLFSSTLHVLFCHYIKKYLLFIISKFCKNKTITDFTVNGPKIYCWPKIILATNVTCHVKFHLTVEI